MNAVWTGVGLLAALLIQAALGRLAPAHELFFDPFLLVVVYAGLVGDDVRGMWTGAVAGWVQDIQFGGTVSGLTGLTKLLVGFGVGTAGTRFVLTSRPARVLVILCASLLDTLLFERLAAVLGVQVSELTLESLLTRGGINAGAGLVLFEILDRHLGGNSR